MKDKVGIIGLGAMGGLYARHLLNAGFEVIGCDLVESHVTALVEQGMKSASTPKDTAELSDVLISSLPSLKALQEVIGGDNGILKCDKDSQILIDTTTLKVEDKIALGELMSVGGKVFLDAPISGTPPMVEELQASLYVSGDEAAYQRCKPIIWLL